MRRLVSTLFVVSDLFCAVCMIYTVMLFGRILSNTLTLTFSSGLDLSGGQLLFEWGIVLLSVVTASAGLFGYFLLIKRRFIGLAILGVLLVLALLAAVILRQDILPFYLYAATSQVVILGLPWLLVYLEYRKRESSEAS